MLIKNIGSASGTQPPSRPKIQERFDPQEDAWINDVAMVARPKSSEHDKQAQKSAPAHSKLNESHPTQDQAGEQISIGHQLWPVLLHLSESIWQEIHQKPDVAPISEPVMAEYIRKRAIDLLRAEPVFANQVRDVNEAERLLQRVVEEILGYGPLEILLKDESISEITTIGPRLIYFEQNGRFQEAPVAFEDDRHMLRVIQNMMRRSGRRAQPNWPIVDLQLPGGSLVNIVLPPSAANGPVITIRKPRKKIFTLTHLVQFGALSQEMAQFLTACIQARLNIVVCGGMDSDRITLLNALSLSIPAEERIVTIEDIAELQLSQKHVVKLIAQLTGPAGSSRVTMRDLVINALRMSPERIIVCECKGEETAALLQAMYSGRDGTLLSLYANGIRDSLTHLETMSQLGGINVPITSLRAQISRSIDLIVYQTRLRDGTYKVMNIAEVQSIDSDVIKLQSIFYYHENGVDLESGKVMGAFEPAGYTPTFKTRLESMDIHLPQEMFVPSPSQYQKSRS